MVNPTPTIILDGSILSCAVDHDDVGRPVLSTDHGTLIGDLTIDWGRDDQWTQPEPSVLTFTMWEAQPGEWLDRVMQRRAMRLPTAIIYTRGGTDPGDRYIFQGFTTNVDVTESTQMTKNGPTKGWLVQVQASDRTGFLGQVNWYSGELPEERMDQRAVRIRNQAAAVGIRQMYFEDRFRAGAVKPVKVTDKTVLDTLNDMYKSFADQYYYEPNRNVVNRIPTGSQWGNYTLHFGRSDTDNAVRLYPPYWTDPTGQEDPIDRVAYPGAYIGACDVAGKIALSANMIQDITVISCKWFNKPGGSDITTNVVAKDSQPPARLEFESWYNDGVYVDPVIESVRLMVNGDGARPTHPQIRWDTTQTGDIPDWPTFESLTLPAQTIRMVVLAGSPFSAATGNAPVWHPSGGVVRYGAGRWDITMNLAPTSMPLGADYQPVTCATVNQSIVLGPDAGLPRHLDKSITSFDLYYVSITEPGLYLYN